MCGRFSATFAFHEVRVRWNLRDDFPPFAARYNIAPSQTVPVIVRRQNGNELKPMRWGLVPSWTQDPSIGNPMINARAETLGVKPSFKQLIGSRRCLIPADGFYEWRREGRGKVPVWIHLKKKEPFAFAGLWDLWRGPEGSELYSFTIITTEANKLVRRIHNRMPVILDPLRGQSWLDPVFTSLRTLCLDLRPFPSDMMEAHEVSPLVNSPENDVPECVQPYNPPLPAQLSVPFPGVKL